MSRFQGSGLISLAKAIYQHAVNSPSSSFAAGEARFAEGAELFRAGDPADLVYVVRSGTVELSQRIYGAERRIGFAGPGDTIGEAALLNGRRHLVSARALEPVVALALSVQTTLELVAEQPEVGLKMLQKLTERVCDGHEQLGRVLEREVVFRVAQALSAIADAQPQDPKNNGHRVVRVKNEELAGHAKIDPNSLLDVLALLADKGLARRKDFATLVIASRVELESFVESLVGARKRTRVLLVDDSSLFRRVMKNALAPHEDIAIVGVGADGQEALGLVRTLRPDVVIMDVQMPIINGLEATRTIMAEIPTPILIMTSLADADDGSLTFEALRAGAIGLWPKPSEMPMKPRDVQRLVDELRKLAEIDVKRVSAPTFVEPGQVELSGAHARRIGIVAEAGGPQALAWLLAHLPANFPGQILLAQHLEAAHHKTLAEWLTTYGKLPCAIAQDGEAFAPGTVRIAPPGFDLVVNPDGHLGLEPSAPEVQTPGNHLLESLALFEGPTSIGVILSGGGSDGARGLRMLRDAGGLAFVQHPGDAVVDSMARAALRSVPEARSFGLSELPGILTQLSAGLVPAAAAR